MRRAPINIPRDAELFELRRYNTELCLELTIDALREFGSVGYVVSVPQKSIGRYYSFMPAVLKEICAQRFPSYLKTRP